MIIVLSRKSSLFRLIILSIITDVESRTRTFVTLNHRGFILVRSRLWHDFAFDSMTSW